MKWQGMGTAPKDGTRILAVASGRGGRWEHLQGRMFVIWHMGTTERMGYDMGWAVFPGLGAGDDFFDCWLPLDWFLPLPEHPMNEPGAKEPTGGDAGAIRNA